MCIDILEALFMLLLLYILKETHLNTFNIYVSLAISKLLKVFLMLVVLIMLLKTMTLTILMFLEKDILLRIQK